MVEVVDVVELLVLDAEVVVTDVVVVFDVEVD